jgi:hypothetical protein
LRFSPVPRGFLLETGVLPLVDLREVVVHGRQLFFVADGGDPFIYACFYALGLLLGAGCFIGALHLVKL